MTLGLPIEGKRELRFGDLLILLPVSLSKLSVFFSPHSTSLLNENNYYILSVYYRFHTQYFVCITFLTLAKLCEFRRGRVMSHFSPCTPNEERPSEDKERRLSEIQEESSHQNLVMLAQALILGFQSPELEEIHFCYVSHPVYCIFLWQPELMNATTLLSEPLSSVFGYFLWPEQ